MTKMDRTAKLVEFGQGGDSVEYGRGSHGSGYGTPENPHAADPATTNIPDGCPAIDKRAAIGTPEGYAWVFKGPMVNVDLPTGKTDRCPDLRGNLMVHAMATDPGNQFGQLAALQVAHTLRSKDPGPLDHVDIETYVNGWREHGARIGHYNNGQIIWETDK